MSRGTALYLGILGLAAASCAPADAAERADLATLVTVFDQMAIRDHGRISKWVPGRGPLTIKVTANFGDKENAVLNSAVTVLGESAQIKIVRNDAAEKPHFLVETSRDVMTQLDVSKFTVGQTNSILGRLGGDMRAATIKIIPDWHRGDPYQIYRTLPHEMMHALGFLGHAQFFDSAMSLQETRNSLSDWDLFFVRVLYDPKLPVGTPRVFALPLVCRLMHQRLIDENNSDSTDLNRGGQHPYCEQLATIQVTAKTPAEHARLGWAYLRGLGVAQNFDEAEQWTRKALAMKDPDAQGLLDAIEKARLARRQPPPIAKVEPVPAISAPQIKTEPKAVAKLAPETPARPTAKPSPPATVAFKPVAPGTVFVLANNGGRLKVDRVEGATVYTRNSSDASYRWAGLFFGRGARIGASAVEQTAESIWPLQIGKSIEFDHRGIGPNGEAMTWKNTIKVLRTETIKIAERDVATYVVERHVTKVIPREGEPYEGVYTFWYAPDYGFHAKYISRFQGKTSERPVSWTVAQVLPPDDAR